VTESDAPVGELFDPYDPDSIAAAMGRALADPALYEACRREARRLALVRFNWEIEDQPRARRGRASSSPRSPWSGRR